VINPAFLALSEPFSSAYFAAGNISVGFTPIKGDDLVLFDERAEPAISIPAHGCERFLSNGSFEFSD
jgi:hypothetical protein